MKKVGGVWGTGVCIARICTLGELELGKLDWASLYWAKDPRPFFEHIDF